MSPGRPHLTGAILIAAAAAGCLAPKETLTESAASCTFLTAGRNPYFVLEPGWTLLLAGEEGGEKLELAVRILDETQLVDNVTTRVMVEEESVAGDLVERSRNFLAYCAQTKSVYYFGEDVDDYENGEVMGHAGAWRAGNAGAKAGILVPGSPTVGLSHYQEQAPGVAMDFAEVVALDETISTPAGDFTGAMKVRETTPLERGVVEHKWYAQGVGVAIDGPARLVWYGDRGSLPSPTAVLHS